MSEDTPNADHDYDIENRIARRPVLKATAASAALGVGTGPVSAHSDDGGSNGGGPGTGDGSSNLDSIDSIFGKAVAGGNPCAGDASEECFEGFRPPVRPDHEIEMRIDIPGPLFAAAEEGEPSGVTTETINLEVADGEVTDRNLHRPDAGVITPEEETFTVADIAGLVADTLGFNFDPAGLHVEPGDIVLYSAESPDHLVAAYHEGHGRQNRVPDGAGPISSPMPPVGGYWLYQFETEGVYDLYCSPHQTFGMVHRVVVHDEGDIPTLDIQETGRPPTAENALAAILGGLDPNVPSSAEVLDSDALEPTNIVNNGPIPWADVVTEHRTG